MKLIPYFSIVVMIKAVTMKNLEQEEKTRKLLNKVNERLLDIQTLKGGWLMSGKVLRVVLKEFPQLNSEWETLQGRKHRLERKLWSVA